MSDVRRVTWKESEWEFRHEWLDDDAGDHALIPWEQWERVVGALEMVDGVMCNFPEWWYENEFDEVIRRALEEIGGGE